jgi:hypothetical protein
MEDGTISCKSYAYSLRRGRRLPPTLEVEELNFCNCNGEEGNKTTPMK